MTTILHVEDDDDLAEAVKDCFEAFGFRGAMREVAATALDEMASWIMAHAPDADLRDQVARLRADAARLRTEP